MAIEVVSIGSSSSGNSYIIKAGNHNILVDVGLTAKRILAAIAEAGLEPDNIEAVLVTHEHIDHVRSVRAIGRKCPGAVFYASRGTVECTQNFAYIPPERLRIVSAGDIVELDGLTIRTFGLSHDAAEPLGYAVVCGNDKLAVVTDTGIITDEIYSEIRDADMLVFESNHDENMLMYGEYPYRVKVRIKSDHGHLSNHYAGDILARLLTARRDAAGLRDTADSGDTGEISRGGRPLRIMLAHLSEHNNAPLYARQTVESILNEHGFERGDDYTLTIASKDETCGIRL